jgi:hypothetical protein
MYYCESGTRVEGVLEACSSEKLKMKRRRKAFMGRILMRVAPSGKGEIRPFAPGSSVQFVNTI